MKNILSLSLCMIYLTSNGQSWLLNGNTGTNYNTNFIGTTDNMSLVFKVNNRFSGTIQNSTPSNTYFGYESGITNISTSGYWNVGIGCSALRSNTTGYVNTAIGLNSLFYNTIGNNNNAFGQNALFNNISGNYNTAIGVQAMFSNTTGGMCIAIGNAALQKNNSNNNIAIGHQAGSSITTGKENCLIGSASGYAITAGSGNACIGQQAGSGNSSGNSVLGVYALVQPGNTGGNNNVVGNLSMYKNTTGANNCAFGRESMYSKTTGDRNISIGNKSLFSSTSCSDNIVIGFEAMLLNTTGNGNVVIGNYAVPTQTFSNKLWIENNKNAIPLIYGDFSSKQIGIGTVYPLSKLSVVATTETFPSVVNISGNSGYGTQLYINTASGSPGVTLGDNVNINLAGKQAFFAMAKNNYDFFGNSSSGDLIINARSGKIIFGLGASSGTSGTPFVVLNNRGLSIGNGNINLPEPTATLQATGIGVTNATYCVKFNNADGDSLLHITDGGQVTGVIEGGEHTPTLTNAGNVSLSIVNKNTLFTRIGQIVDAEYSIQVTPLQLSKACYLYVTLPIKTKKPYSVIGEGAAVSGSNDPRVPVIAIDTNETTFMVSFLPVISTPYVVNFHIKYAIY